MSISKIEEGLNLRYAKLARELESDIDDLNEKAMKWLNNGYPLIANSIASTVETYQSTADIMWDKARGKR